MTSTVIKLSENDFLNKIAQILGISLDKVTREAKLNELVQDSFILVDLLVELQDHYLLFLNHEDLITVSTVEDLYHVLENKSLRNMHF